RRHAAEVRLQGLRLQLLRRLRLARLRLQLQLEAKTRRGHVTRDGGAESWGAVDTPAEGKGAHTVTRAIRIASNRTVSALLGRVVRREPSPPSLGRERPPERDRIRPSRPYAICRALRPRALAAGDSGSASRPTTNRRRTT